MKKIVCAAVVAMSLLLPGCKDSHVALKNMETAADEFRVERRITFINGFTDNIMLSVVGYCSVENLNNRLKVICKTAENQFFVHQLGLSDNATYVVEQLKPEEVSVSNYRLIFKFGAIVPDVEFK